jgi:hypothetical protein
MNSFEYSPCVKVTRKKLPIFTFYPLRVQRQDQMQERRKVVRTRVLKGAKLLLGEYSVIDCTLRNVTNVGAAVEMPNTLDLSETFDMTFDGGHSFRRCRCVWRKLTRMGVEFI